MARWDYQQTDYNAVDVARIRNNGELFNFVAIASFIEITSDIYEKNLAAYYEGDEELTGWLSGVWEPEELQHGQALRRYVETVWPDFDWETAYRGFREEYGAMCRIEAFQPTRGTELLARMVVETGTSTFYKALRAYAEALCEPVLAKIAENISKDEIYHFEHFEAGFRKYNETEKLSRVDIFRVIGTRLREAGDEDIKVAFSHIRPGVPVDSLRLSMKTFAKKHYPYTMAVRMLMRPLRLNPLVESATAATLRGALKVLGI